MIIIQPHSDGAGWMNVTQSRGLQNGVVLLQGRKMDVYSQAGHQAFAS